MLEFVRFTNFVIIMIIIIIITSEAGSLGFLVFFFTCSRREILWIKGVGCYGQMSVLPVTWWTVSEH